VSVFLCRHLSCLFDPSHLTLYCKSWWFHAIAFHKSFGVIPLPVYKTTETNEPQIACREIPINLLQSSSNVEIFSSVINFCTYWGSYEVQCGSR
jgi:hypothetical protein